MKRVSLISTVFVGLTFTCGCMTSRSRCDINYENDSVVISSASEVTTSQKYAIREIRGNSCPSAIDDSVMGEVVGTIASAERIMHTCPGVFERNGEEIFVDIVSFSRETSYQWTAIPCFLTVGICPYFQKDKTDVTAEVSLISDPTKKSRFSYQLIDDWKISFLFQLGSIPYTEYPLENKRIGKRGNGDISDEVHREGFSVGVVKALKELEQCGSKQRSQTAL